MKINKIIRNQKKRYKKSFNRQEKTICFSVYFYPYLVSSISDSATKPIFWFPNSATPIISLTESLSKIFS